jgi:hypothetical protein
VFFLILFFSGKKSETIEPENKKKSEACGMLNQTSAAAVQTQGPKTERLPQGGTPNVRRKCGTPNAS